MPIDDNLDDPNLPADDNQEPPFVARYWRYYKKYEDEFTAPDEAADFLMRGEEDSSLSAVGVFYLGREIELCDTGEGWRYKE